MTTMYRLFLLSALTLTTTARADQPAPADAPKCRALDAGKQIAEAKGASASDCSFALREDVKRHFCKKGSKGKTFKFTVDFDHKLGERKWPAKQETMYCANEL